MPHRSRIDKIVIDVAPEDHERELAFWQGATGKKLKHYERYPEYHGGVLPGAGMGLLIQRLGEGDSRVHLDIHTDDVEAEVVRLESLGAQRVREVNGWWIMRDPAGLPFCVIPDDTLTADNSHHWD